MIRPSGIHTYAWPGGFLVLQRDISVSTFRLFFHLVLELGKSLAENRSCVAGKNNPVHKPELGRPVGAREFLDIIGDQLIALDLGIRRILDLPAKENRDHLKRKSSNLKSLSLKHNNLIDISSLSLCPNIRSLDLDDNRIEDASPINKLNSLHSLSINNNEIKDANPLSECKKMQSLSINYNKLANFSSFRRLRAVCIKSIFCGLIIKVPSSICDRFKRSLTKLIILWLD